MTKNKLMLLKVMILTLITYTLTSCEKLEICTKSVTFYNSTYDDVYIHVGSKTIFVKSRHTISRNITGSSCYETSGYTISGDYLGDGNPICPCESGDQYYPIYY